MKAFIIILAAAMANCIGLAFWAMLQSGHPFDAVRVGQGGQTSTTLHLNLEWWLFAFILAVFSLGLGGLLGTTIAPFLLPKKWREKILEDWNKE